MSVESILKPQNQSSNKYSDKVTRHRLKRPRLNLNLAINLLLIFFIFTYALIGMRNLDLRMANLHEDDGPILYAQVFKAPYLFEDDFQAGAPLQLRTLFLVLSSAMNWTPALLWRYLDIDPYLTTWIITLVQILSFGLSIYVLTAAMSQERAVRVLAVVFAYSAGLWGWNPANYGSRSERFFSPYAAHLAIAPILLAFACLLHKRNKMALLLLTVAGLIHPNLALYAGAITGIYWLWQGIRNRSSATLYRLASLTVVMLIIILPALLVKITLPVDSLPRDEIITGMRHNQHLWPWGNDRWNFSLQTTLKWLILAILSWRWRPKFSVEVQSLWGAAIVCASIASLGHIIGAVWQIPMLLNFTGFRAFIWPVFLSLPLVCYYWVAHIRSGNWPGAVLSILCLVLPIYAQEYALFWPLIVGLLLVDISQGCLSAWHFDLPGWARYLLYAVALGVLLVWSASFLAMPFDLKGASNSVLTILAQLTWYNANPFVWNAVGPLPQHSERVILLIVIAIIGLGIWGWHRLIYTPQDIIPAGYQRSWWPGLLTLIIVLYGAKFLWVTWQNAEIEAASAVAYLDVQLWARKYTPPSSLFVVPFDGWRTMSLRRKLFPFTSENYAYIAPTEAKQHRDRLLAFYGISEQEAEARRGYGPGSVYKMETDRFWNFDENDFLNFASQFGATHLVMPAQSRYRLPLVYENRQYVVYRLEAYPSLELMRHQVETTLADAVLDLRFATFVNEEKGAYILARTGQQLKAEGSVQMADGPGAGSPALMVEDQTRLTGPPAALDLSQGSLSVWARLALPAKRYSDLVKVNKNKDLYIYHQGEKGIFYVFYNGVELGHTVPKGPDDRWHHYVFTWQEGEQKFYIDGIQMLSGQAPACSTSTELFAIGWLGTNDSEQWGGLMADLITFNRPLSSDEVAAFYLVSRPSDN
jgi:hypothetical protein